MTTLALPEELTIYEVGELFAEIKDQLSQSDVLQVDASALMAIDSAVNSAVARRLSRLFQARLSQNMRRLRSMTRCGRSER